MPRGRQLLVHVNFFCYASTYYYYYYYEKIRLKIVLKLYVGLDVFFKKKKKN